MGAAPWALYVGIPLGLYMWISGSASAIIPLIGRPLRPSLFEPASVAGAMLTLYLEVWRCEARALA